MAPRGILLSALYEPNSSRIRMGETIARRASTSSITRREEVIVRLQSACGGIEELTERCAVRRRPNQWPDAGSRPAETAEPPDSAGCQAQASGREPSPGASVDGAMLKRQGVLTPQRSVQMVAQGGTCGARTRVGFVADRHDARAAVAGATPPIPSVEATQMALNP